MAQFEALQSLMRNKPQVPQYDPEMEELGPTDLELEDEQAGIAREGAQSGSDYFYVPSRESLKTSQMGALKRALKIAETTAQQKAYPQQVAGEFGLEQARVRGGAQVEAARLGAERAGAEREFRGEQSQLGRDAMAERATQAQGAVADRTAATQRATGERQEAARRGARVTGLQSGKINAPVEPGMFAGLKRMFGMGQSQEEANQAEVAQLQAGDSGVSEVAQQYRAAHPTATPQQLMQIIQQQETDATPEELAELFEALR